MTNDINGKFAKKRQDRYHFGAILGLVGGIIVAILLGNTW